jgi:hypothetical protein
LGLFGKHLAKTYLSIFKNHQNAAVLKGNASHDFVGLFLMVLSYTVYSYALAAYSFISNLQIIVSINWPIAKYCFDYRLLSAAFNAAFA